jgi:hypothetical protein
MGKTASLSVRVAYHRVRLAIDWRKIVFWLAAVILPWGAIIALGYWFTHSSADHDVPETDVLRFPSLSPHPHKTQSFCGEQRDETRIVT